MSVVSWPLGIVGVRKGSAHRGKAEDEEDDDALLIGADLEDLGHG